MITAPTNKDTTDKFARVRELFDELFSVADQDDRLRLFLTFASQTAAIKLLDLGREYAEHMGVVPEEGGGRVLQVQYALSNAHPAVVHFKAALDAYLEIAVGNLR